MKKSLLLLLCFLFIICTISFAQKPEKIYGKNIVLKSNDYYLQQKELWKAETEKNSKNADAWYNYYRADRNSYIVGEETDSLNTKGINRFQRLEKIVSNMENQIPNSFEYNFAKWLNGNNNHSLFPYLEKAHKLAPERTEPLMSLVYYYETKGNYPLKAKYAKEYYDTGEFSPGILNYGYNMLVGLEKDAIVLTEGDKDTDAILLLQNGKGIRTDVQLLNLNLLLIIEYRERIFKELEIPAFSIDPLANDEGFYKYQQTIIEHITKNKKGRPIYVAISASEPFTKNIKEKLFLTGLAYRYSTTKIDELEILKNNFEELYALDYLKIYFAKDMTIEMTHRFNLNYLPAIYLLHKYYSNSDNPLNANPEKQSKAKTYFDLMQKIKDDSPDKE